MGDLSSLEPYWEAILRTHIPSENTEVLFKESICVRLREQDGVRVKITSDHLVSKDIRLLDIRAGEQIIFDGVVERGELDKWLQEQKERADVRK